MSSYDEISVDGRRGQVKLWKNEMDVYEEGDEVPLIPGEDPDFSIAMREGGYVNIEDGEIVSWTDDPLYPENIFDKWGASFYPDSAHGMLGEPYFHRDILDGIDRLRDDGDE